MKQPYRILLTEDDRDIRELVFELLKGEDFDCVQASDGLEAKQILEKEKFDLLITDLRMPRMDGVELLEWCRQSKIHFPVIFISANTELLPKEQLALEDCCAAIINKPMDMDSILRAIAEAKTRNHLLHC
ncbi:MAG: response regulator [Bacteriovorax sp.]|nr:response regulator [Bacteriovorax sp.]